MIGPIAWYARPGRHALHGAPEGFDALATAHAADALADQRRPVLHIVRDDSRLAQFAEAVGYFAPHIELQTLPAWDCQPYDRVSPNGDIVSQRLDALTRLAAAPRPAAPRIIVATVAAALQRMPARATLAPAILEVKLGDRIATDRLIHFFLGNGYNRTDTVREPGEFAVRGGILDVFPSGVPEPLRLDFFGDALDAIRAFDPLSQRSIGSRDAIAFRPVSEIFFDAASIERFRSGYRALFGPEQPNDGLFEAVSAGRKHIGMEHWLPLFHDRLETVFDYAPNAAISLDSQVEEAAAARIEQIDEYYEARRAMMRAAGKDGAPYNPLPPDRLYLTRDDWRGALSDRPVALYAAPPGGESRAGADLGARLGRDFGDIRAQPDGNLFGAVRDQVAALIVAGKRVVISAHSAGARDRLRNLLRENGVDRVDCPDSWAEAETLPKGRLALITLGLARGFVTDRLALIAEGDILGDRLIRSARKRRNANFISDAADLAEGDLVVHVDHGIGRYDGLATLQIGGAPHDCLRVVYAGNDKLFVPVENIDVLSRFGSEEALVQLDRLGGVAWQARKSKVKQRIRAIAESLIKIAAERELRSGESLAPPPGAYDEFAAGFPHAETEDQLRAIEDTLADLASGRPTDRLICGDVGFGKTEVAMRAAFAAVMAGTQVAVVVPTTLLARQHYRNFAERFANLPVCVAQLSRLVPAKLATQTKKELAEGKVDLIIGTHALLAKSIAFRDLGLLIVDEEQHFGVAQKERMKELKANVHVLTLTATPIPRTLQLALSGVRDMSIIATPPVDRLAIRTFVMPYDPVIVREAIMRERFRGGQSFYVCPRIEDLDGVAERLRKLVPEASFAIAHGRMAAAQLDDVMNAFCDGKYDVLLSTNIVESGLDIPTANTMIIHRADMFGLAQLYQLRGRIGRSKTRAYAYLTLPHDKVTTPAAMKRLDVMQTLDQLGAGFQLASHDLDIRGAGNLLGEEQSGHIREVGIELYQQMLEEAVTAARAGGDGATEAPAGPHDWSPQITLGTPVLIPEGYVADLPVRLSLYRRIANLADRPEIDALAAEMVDRFGPLPAEVDNLFSIIQIKQLCREAGVDKLDAGPKGLVLSFRENNYKNPRGLIDFIQTQSGAVKLRPDHKLVYMRDWERPTDRIGDVQKLVEQLARMAA